MNDETLAMMETQLVLLGVLPKPVRCSKCGGLGWLERYRRLEAYWDRMACRVLRRFRQERCIGVYRH